VQPEHDYVGLVLVKGVLFVSFISVSICAMIFGLIRVRPVLSQRHSTNLKEFLVVAHKMVVGATSLAHLPRHMWVTRIGATSDRAETSRLASVAPAGISATAYRRCPCSMRIPGGYVSSLPDQIDYNDPLLLLS
jgi:hypothetical protein